MADGRKFDEKFSESPSRRRAGRPREQVLTREIIARGALELLDSVGETRFTVARLAKQLGVSPSALYSHFSGKDEVMSAVRELISDRINVEPFRRLPWDEALVEWAHSYREAFAAHPITIAMFAISPATEAKRTLLMYEGVIEPLIAAGWPRSHVVSMMVALESFILGSALDATAPPDMFDPGPHAGDVPEFSAALYARELSLEGRSPADEAFELGLQAMISGLRELYDRLRQ